MQQKGLLTMSSKESLKIHVIQKVDEKLMKQKNAAKALRCTQRHIRRMLANYRKYGIQALIHRSRGLPSPNKVTEEEINKITRLYRTDYAGFGPTLFKEKLEEKGIYRDKETIRQILINDESWIDRPKKKKHRKQRARMPNSGMLVQLDGSHDDWFENRAPKCVLMAYIDDATSQVYSKFYEYEGTLPALDSFIGYIQKYGIPLALYADLHQTYKVNNKKITIEDELNNNYPLSRFQQAVQELGVQIIPAYSPQAKGRVERLFRTLQDRLKKELRINKISSIRDANKFLPAFLKEYNKKFSKKYLSQGDVHKPALPTSVLRKSLCLKIKRSVANDFTVKNENFVYQIKESTLSRTVTVEKHTNGLLLIKDKHDRPLKYKTIKKPENIKKEANGKWDMPKIDPISRKEIYA
jgi:transposase